MWTRNLLQEFMWRDLANPLTYIDVYLYLPLLLLMDIRGSAWKRGTQSDLICVSKNTLEVLHLWQFRGERRIQYFVYAKNHFLPWLTWKSKEKQLQLMLWRVKLHNLLDFAHKRKASTKFPGFPITVVAPASLLSLHETVCCYVQYPYFFLPLDLSRSKMEEIPESSKEDPQPERGTQTGFSPRISEAMAEFLVNTVASTAKIVQAAVEAQKSAQVPPQCPRTWFEWGRVSKWMKQLPCLKKSPQKPGVGVGCL